MLFLQVKSQSLFTRFRQHRWDKLTDRQLAGRVQETYGMTNGEDDAQRQLTDWQQRLGEIERSRHQALHAGERRN